MPVVFTDILVFFKSIIILLSFESVLFSSIFKLIVDDYKPSIYWNGTPKEMEES